MSKFKEAHSIARISLQSANFPSCTGSKIVAGVCKLLQICYVSLLYNAGRIDTPVGTQDCAMSVNSRVVKWIFAEELDIATTRSALFCELLNISVTVSLDAQTRMHMIHQIFKTYIDDYIPKSPDDFSGNGFIQWISGLEVLYGACLSNLTDGIEIRQPVNQEETGIYS